MRAFFSSWSICLALFCATFTSTAQPLWITNSNPERALTASNFVNYINTNFAIVYAARLAGLHYVSNLTSDAQAQIDRKLGGAIRVSFEGDSIVNQDLPTWPDYVREYSSYFAGSAYFTNYGLSGGRAFTMQGEYATQAHLNRPTLTNEIGWFFLHAGGNDIGDGVAPATVYQYLKNLWDAARADGYKVVAVRVMQRRDWDVYLPDIELARQQLNALIASDPTLYDYLAAPDLIMQDNEIASGYYYDGTHPTEGGARIIAKAVIDAIFPSALPPFQTFAIADLATNSARYVDLEMNRVRKFAIGTTNTAATFTIARRDQAAGTGGYDDTFTPAPDVIMRLANNNAIAGKGFLAINVRSSGQAGFYLGNNDTEPTHWFTGGFSGALFGWHLGGVGIAPVQFNDFGLGVGLTNNAAARIESRGTFEQLRLSYDATNRATFTVDSAGSMHIDPSGPGLYLDAQVIGNNSILSTLASAGFGTTTRGYWIWTSDGNVRLFDSAITTNNKSIGFGSTTNEPALVYNSATGRLDVRTGSGSSVLYPLAASSLMLTTNFVHVFSNNAAAITGGVPVGGLYRSGGDPDQLYIVH